MSYSFWRPQTWRPGALAPLPPSYATGLSAVVSPHTAINLLKIPIILVAQVLHQYLS